MQLKEKWNFKTWPSNNPIFYLLLSHGYLEFFLQNGYGAEMTNNPTTWL
jgi:hypothetical protein